MRPHSTTTTTDLAPPGLGGRHRRLAAPGAAEPTGAAPLSAAPGTSIAVSYADLPPALDLVPYAVVDVPVDTELEVGTNVPQAAVLADGGVILVEESSPTAYLVGRDGSASSVALDVTPKFIVATPGPVVYGLDAPPDGALEFVAVSLTGANAGQVVARQPVADPALYLELPIGTFGSTAAGVVDRVRQPGAVMIGHVDMAGNPVTVDAAALWTIDGDNVVSDGSRQWSLAIERHPDAHAAVRRRVAAGPDVRRRRCLLDLPRAADRGRRVLHHGAGHRRAQPGRHRRLAHDPHRLAGRRQ